MQSHMAQHRTERVLAPLRSRHCEFNSLGNGCSERALMVRVLSENILACACRHRRGWRHLSPEQLHHGAAVGLLLIGNLHLIDGSLQPEQFRCIGKCRSPLAGSRLRRDVGYAFLLTVVGLGQRRIQLVRTHRAYAFVLEIDVRRGVQCLLEPVCADKGSGAVVGVHLADLFRNVNPPVRHVQLLSYAFTAEQHRHLILRHRLVRPGVEHRLRFMRHVCLNVVPLRRNLILLQKESFLSHCIVFYWVF